MCFKLTSLRPTRAPVTIMPVALYERRCLKLARKTQVISQTSARKNPIERIPG